LSSLCSEKTAESKTPPAPTLSLQRTWKYDPKKDYEPIKEAWNASLAAGQTFFDTAEVYGSGESERIIGKLLKETSEEKRKEVIIATKCEVLLLTPTSQPASERVTPQAQTLMSGK
jgi:aryl-alcohol dehydrogenase-like predicted oxidoreductase